MEIILGKTPVISNGHQPPHNKFIHLILITHEDMLMPNKIQIICQKSPSQNQHSLYHSISIDYRLSLGVVTTTYGETALLARYII